MEKGAYAQSVDKSALVGTGAGILVWLVLFLPITTFLVQPAINSITTMLAMQSQKVLVSEQIIC